LGSVYFILACGGYSICSAQAIPYVPLGGDPVVDNLHNLSSMDEVCLNRLVSVSGAHDLGVTLKILGGDTDNHVATISSLVKISTNQQREDSDGAGNGTAANGRPEWGDTVHFLFWYGVGSVIAGILSVIYMKLPNSF
jgi:hypothetical protein